MSTNKPRFFPNPMRWFALLFCKWCRVIPIALLTTSIAYKKNFAQTVPSVAVIEQSNYRSQYRHIHKGREKFRYQTFLRPLFIKTDGEWKKAFQWPDRLGFYRDSASGGRTVRARKAYPTEDSLIVGHTGLYRHRPFQKATRPLPRASSRFEYADVMRYTVVATRRKWVYKAEDFFLGWDTTERQAIADALSKRIVEHHRNGSSWFKVPDGDTTILEEIKNSCAQKPDLLEQGSSFTDARGNRILQIIYPHCTGGTDVQSAWSVDDFREDGGPFYITVVQRKSGEVVVLYADMDLLCHTDFDGDGEEEYLFFYSEFNTYGYLLFYDDFRKHAEYLWHYH